MEAAFLTAEWRWLAMLNYAVDPAVLKPFVPSGTELDFYGDMTYVSVVGFQFLNTRVWGAAIPFHRDFEEVNLRFYVRYKAPEGWRRGVVFVREWVPRFAIAWVARMFYGEPYLALPMRHAVAQSDTGLQVRYSWQRAGVWESLEISATGKSREMEIGSKEEFITEHYWGYTARGFRSNEYQVEHPRWRIWPADHCRLEADVTALYGDRFAESLSLPPDSAFLADGSPVIVRKASRVG
jgi:uncharacterized protein YqjF (DUF2071 family)